MDEILVATPLSSAIRPHTFSNGISVQKIEPILWNNSSINRFVSENDRVALEETDYWLCASKQAAVIRNESDDLDILYETVQRAMWAVQIIYPLG